MKLSKAFTEFLIAKRADGLSAQTVQWYESIISQFVETMPTATLEGVTRSQLRAYIASLAERGERYQNAIQKPVQIGGLSASTIEAHKRALSVFWAWCQEEYDLLVNPYQGIKRKNRIAVHPRAISMDTLLQLMEAANQQETPFAERDNAILYLMADTGVRAAGLVGLALNEVDPVRLKVVVQEKGMKRRAIPYTETTRVQLYRWLAVRPGAATKVFCNLGITRLGDPLTTSGLNQILKRLRKKAGIKEPVSPHRIRHMFAKEYLNKGGDLATLARLMGHASIDITSDAYAVFTNDETAEFHKRFSPINALLKDE